MFERFNGPAISALMKAEQFAKAMGEPEVGDIQLLMAVSIDDSIAEHALLSLGIKAKEVLRAFEEETFLDENEVDYATSLSYSDSFKRVSNLAHEISMQMGDRYTGTEHLLISFYSQELPSFGSTVYFDSVGLSAFRITRAIQAIRSFGLENSRVVFNIKVDPDTGEIVILLPIGSEIDGIYEGEDKSLSWFDLKHRPGELRIFIPNVVKV